MGLFGAVAVFTLYFLYKRYNASNEFLAIYAAFMLFFAFFMLPTRIHERYLFPAISVLALMFPFLKKTRPLYAVLTATLLINQAYVLYWLNVSYPNAAPNLTGDPVVLAVSAINLLMFIYASTLMWDELRGHRVQKTEPRRHRPVEPKPRGRRTKMNFGLQINKKDLITIVLLSVVFFSIAIVNLGEHNIPLNSYSNDSWQSFYVNLGNQTNVKSMLFLLDSGAMNVTVSSGITRQLDSCHKQH